MNTSTIESTVTAEQVRTAMQQIGYGTYGNYSESLANSLNHRGVSAGTVLEFARAQGYRALAPQTADAFISALRGTGTDTQSEEQVSEVEGFDRDRAAQVIRQAAESMGANMEAVEEVLIEAGLVDEPEPEVEEEPEADEPSNITEAIKAAVQEAVAPLVAFARRHGFDG